MTTTRLTPVRRQWLTIKHSYPDALLLFRMGDFYECFDEDAHTLAAALEIVLTSRPMGRGNPVPLSGIPAVSLDANLAKLIRQGHKVAICEQLSDPATAKGIVERGVVRVVTPGTVLESALLDHKANNYLAAVCPEAGGGVAGLAYVDVTTGEFAAAQVAAEGLAPELARLEPSEILVPPGDEGAEWAAGGGGGEARPVTALAAAAFEPEAARRALLEYYGVLSLEAYGIESLPLATRAAGAIVDYLRYTYQGKCPTLTPPVVYHTDAYMTLDAPTRRNLELYAAGRWDSRDWSLLAALDDTRTPMGGRLLRRWLGQPLLDLGRLERRLDAVQYFYDDAFRRAGAADALSDISDLERILTRIQTHSAPPRDLLALRQSLAAAAQLGQVMSGDGADGGGGGGGDAEPVSWLAGELHSRSEVTNLIDAAIAPEPSGAVGEGGVIRSRLFPRPGPDSRHCPGRPGVHCRAGGYGEERTGIRNLKVGYNQVFGYYIEVSRANASAVPTHYQRRQTLANGERYITPELKEYENQVLDARERLAELERSLYRQVCQQWPGTVRALPAGGRGGPGGCVRRAGQCGGAAGLCASASG